jgi:hypothetical protein
VPAEAAEPAGEEPPPAVEPEPEDEDDEEVENLSNWNVPSWQELIASLYRPER